MVKIGREVPVASMDNSGKIIWAKHNEIQTVNIKTIGADFEVGISTLLLRTYDAHLHVMKVVEFAPSAGYGWRKITFSCEGSVKHNPNGRFVVVCGDGEYIIYTALAWRNRSFGSSLEFV
ncbi:hypothetical protein BHM03_00059938, partial [Ensete ventricosum]